jgi:hypothetical protein
MAQEPKLRRVEVSEQCWRERVAAWHESGQTQQAFCRAQGYSMSSFSRWKIKLAKQAEAQSAVVAVGPGAASGSVSERRPETLSWTELRWPDVGSEAPLARPESSGFEIVLPRGWSVRLGPHFETESLRRLLVVLEERSC